MIKVGCEGCELDFLKGARRIIDEFHPAIVLEIQDDVTRWQATVVVGGVTQSKAFSV